MRILQYYKNGVVHLNYTATLFEPFWINQVRKFGTAFWGDNRRTAYEGGAKMYELSETEFLEITDLWNLYNLPDIASKFADDKNLLRKVIEFAGSYFESSHTHTDPVRRIVDLAIALEVIFSPGNKDEVSFQLSQLAAEFIGETPEEKLKIFASIKRFYSKRSDLLHGNIKAYAPEFITQNEVEQFSSIIRRAIVKFVSLYLNGRNDHKEIISEIRNGLLNPELSIEVRTKADLQTIIQARRRDLQNNTLVEQKSSI